MAYSRSTLDALSEMMTESGPAAGARMLIVEAVVCMEQRLLWELDGVKER